MTTGLNRHQFGVAITRHWSGKRELVPRLARWEGDHLGCSPCGKAAGRDQCHRLAWPGGAAVALAESNLDYTAGSGNFQFQVIALLSLRQRSSSSR